MTVDEQDSRESGLPIALQDVIDEFRIRQLHARYVDAVNRGAWSEFTDLFTPDAELRVSKGSMGHDQVVGPNAIGKLIGGYVSKYDFLVQTILNARIALREEGNADVAVARLYIAELRQWTATGRRMESAGVYHDRYARIDGRWWFERRRYDRLYATAPRELEVQPFPEDVSIAGSLGVRRP